MKNRAVFSVLLGSLVLLPMLLGATGGREAAVEQTEPVTFWVASSSQRSHNEESLFYQEWQKRAGVDIELIKSEGGGETEKINTMLASGDLPDVMTVPRPIADEYGMQGAFLAFNDYFDDAPTLKKYFHIDENPWIYGSDANLYMLPTSQIPYLDWGWLWRQDWADRLKIATPETVDDLAAAWRKVIRDDPDSIPWVTRGWGFLQPCYGIGGGPEGAYSFRGGELVAPWIDPRMKELIGFVNEMWEEKILWQDVLTANRTKLLEAIATDKTFSVTDYLNNAFQLSHTTEEMRDATVPVAPPEGPYGDSGNFWLGKTSYWGISVTSKCRDVDAAMHMLDYIFSDDGADLYLYGVEGVTYERTASGIEFTDKVKNEAQAEGLDLDTYLAQEYNVFLFTTGVGPAFGAKEQLERLMALETAHPNYIKAQAITAMTLAQPNPPIWNTKEEAARISSLMGNINTFQQEWLVKFATGNEPLERWDYYVQEMKKLGVQEVMDLATRGYQRYLDSVGKSKGYVPPMGIDTSGLARMVGLQ